MAEQELRCRGINALAGHWYRMRQSPGGAPTGVRVLVDLDRGTVSKVTWSESGFETEAETWSGQGVLDGLLQSLSDLFEEKTDEIRSFLLDRDAMASCSSDIMDALLDYPEPVTVEARGRSFTLHQILSSVDPVDESVRALVREAEKAFPDRQGPAGSLILYGACAGFAPLQLRFRQLFDHMENADAFFAVAPIPKPLFDYQADNGELAEEGRELLDSGVVSSGPIRAPFDVTLQLTDAAGNEAAFPLAVKGQMAQELTAESPAFFLAPGSALCCLVDGTSRRFDLPESFLRTGCAAVAVPALERRTFSITLRDAGQRDVSYSFTIDGEVI